jgi:hypothetical protein
MRREREGGHEAMMQRVLAEARETGEWFAVADARMMQFDLTEAEQEEVAKARKALARVRAMAEHPRFLNTEGKLDVKRMKHVWQEARRDIAVARSHGDMEAFNTITEGLAGLAGMMGQEAVPSIAGFVQAVDTPKGDQRLEGAREHYTDLVESFELDPLYEKAMEYHNQYDR